MLFMRPRKHMKHKGKTRKMRCRTETFEVSGERIEAGALSRCA